MPPPLTLPERLRLDSLDVTWAARELPKLRQVIARGLTATLVFDERGASSFGPPSKEPATSPSTRTWCR